MPHPTVVTDISFEDEVLKAQVPVLIHFHATWSIPSQMTGSIVDDLAGAFEGRVKVVRLEVDSNPTTSAKYNVRGVQVVLVFDRGTPALVTARSREGIEHFLDDMLARSLKKTRRQRWR